MDEPFNITVPDPGRRTGKSGKPPSSAPQPSPVLSPEPMSSPSVGASTDLGETIRFEAKVEPVTGWLVVVEGVGRGRSFSLGYGTHSVGRGEGQRVRLAFGDHSISRRHVVISYDPAGRTFYLSPVQGAALLPLHNGQPLLQPCPLDALDRIKLGKTELLFVPLCGPSFGWE